MKYGINMKKILFITVLSIIVISSNAQPSTLLGTHGGGNPGQISSIGSKVVRYGLTDYNIKNVIDTGDSTTINKMVDFNSLNIAQVVFLRFPEDTVGNVGVNFERIPTGTDSSEVFEYLDTFLLMAGPYIDWIQINQEPLGVTKYNDSVYTISDVLNWWRTLAQFIRNKQSENPSQLGHLKILTGGISGIKGVLTNPNSPTVSIIDSIIQFGENYCDAIDLHLNTTSVAIGTQEIAYIRNRTAYSLTCTEWSQADAAKETGWILNVNSVWTNTSDPYFGLLNGEIISNAYVNLMDSTDWHDLINTAPYTTGFIPEFYYVLDSNCFVFACYAAVIQYGSPGFDWRALFTNKTTQSASYNQPFYDEFVNLTSLINNGNYAGNCPANVSVRETYQNDFINVYPNPTNGLFTVSFGDIQEPLYNAILTIYNKQNILIYKTKMKNSIMEISLNNQPSGIYFLRLETAEVTITEKLVIIK